MSVEENKALVRRWFEGVNKRDPDAVAQVLAPDHVRYGPHPDIHGVEAWKSLFRSLFEAFPDYQVIVEDMFAQGDKVAVRFTDRVTHTGAEFQGVPPTGKKVIIWGIIIFTVTDNKIAQEWVAYDSLGAWQQLGVIPPLDELIEQAKAKLA